MKAYNIYLKRNNKNKIDDIISVEEGFSWYAFFFGPFWFAYYSMYKEFAGLLVFNFLVSTLQSPTLLGNIDILLLQSGLSLLVAINANYWRGQALLKQNYHLYNTVFSSSSKEAVAKFIQYLLPNLNFDLSQFDDSILDPKSYFISLKRKKKQPFFTV